MNLLFRGMGWVGLVGASLGSLGLAFLYLSPYYSLFKNYGPGLGPQVHGLELMVGFLYCGIPALLLYVLGLIGALGLRFRRDPSLVGLYRKLTVGLLLLSLLVLAVDYVLPRIGHMIYSRQQAAAGKSKAIVDDPKEFSAYIDSAIDPNLSLPKDSFSPLKEAVLHGYLDLAKKLLDRGAVVYQDDLETAAQKGDPEMTALLWDHSKNLDGGSVLVQAFLFGQFDALKTLTARGVKTDSGIRRLCAYLFVRPITLGQRDWEIFYPASQKGKGYADEMFRFLAQKASDKGGTDGRKTLKIAVYTRDIDIVKMLVTEGFDIHTLDGQFSRSALLIKDREVSQVLTEYGENEQEFDMALEQAAVITRNKEITEKMADYLDRQKVRWK